jgi:hypothetical protein
MEMLLMGLCMSVFGIGIAALAFGAATRSRSSDADATVQPQLPLVKAATAARFFSDRAVASPTVPAIPTSQVPIEVLLLQIENHVRMEQTAAEVFIAFPSQARLRSKTASPFVN